MDTVRQWWLDAAWPNIRKLRWFIAAWIVLALVAIPWGVRAQERSLEAASREALVDTGVTIDDIAFTGRNGVVTAAISASERTRAAAALDSVAGIGTIEWQVTAPLAVAPTTTTTPATTTTMPVGEPATLGLKVQSGRLVIRGVLPDAAAVAAVGAVSEMLYGPEVGNGLTVDAARYAPPWLPAAPEIVALLPMAGDIEVVLDGDGVHLAGTAPTNEADASLRAAIERVVGPDVPTDFSVEVESGELPAVLITDGGDGTASITGTVSRRKLADEIAAATAASSEDTELLNELAVAKDRAEVYLVNRLPNLIAVVGSTTGWELGYEDGRLTGTLAGEGLFRGRRTELSARGDKLIDELAALLIGNPDLAVSIEISTSPAAESDALSTELARRRGFAVLSSLVQSGVEPDRITTSVADAEAEVLRFVLAAADR